MSSLSQNIDKTQIDAIRVKALRILRDLQNDEMETTSTNTNTTDSNSQTIYHDSWVRGKTTCTAEYPTSRCKFFDKHGFLRLEAFCDEDEVRKMKHQMETLVDEKWDPNNEKKKITVFRTDEKQVLNQGSDDYFLESANKVHFFAESKAMNKNGKLKVEFQNKKMLALNKSGHGLHMIEGDFQNYTTSNKIRELVKELGWRDPVVPQSMYIFKQARVGAEVTSHQDSTFLYTTPRQSCLGMWLALDDATLSNGCLWVRPASHREKVRRVFVKNPEHFGEESIKNRSNIAKGDMSKTQMIFTQEPGSETIDWDGKIPSGDNDNEEKEMWEILFDAGFVPIECSAGDLLVFPGELDHLSLPNFSEHQRHTFQLHLVEGEGCGIKWSETNWLQYPKGVPFLSLNTSNK